jgi:hypothetical protein
MHVGSLLQDLSVVPLVKLDQGNLGPIRHHLVSVPLLVTLDELVQDLSASLDLLYN